MVVVSVLAGRIEIRLEASSRRALSALPVPLTETTGLVVNSLDTRPPQSRSCHCLDGKNVFISVDPRGISRLFCYTSSPRPEPALGHSERVPSRSVAVVSTMYLPGKTFCNLRWQILPKT